MSERERTNFRHETGATAAAALQSGLDVRTALEPAFRAARRRHPDDEDRLLELWDELVARPVI